MSTENNAIIWNAILEEIDRSGFFDKATFENWIKNTKLVNMDETTAYVTYPSIISSNLIMQQKQMFENLLESKTGSKKSLELLSDKEAAAVFSVTAMKQQTSQLIQNHFRAEYTFENFVEGHSNAEAYAACLHSCNESRPSFNPLMLYGSSGLGKTHLLHAVGNHLKLNKPQAKVIYMYSGDLITLLNDAMKTKSVYGNSVEIVKQQLLDCDYFLIDDIQNLKINSSQEVFFTIYNRLIEQGTQIIITSDMNPSELTGLQKRLVSRFRQGLTINISRPEFNTSKAILKKKLEGKEEECAIQEDVIDYLALSFSNDIRNLEGQLNRLLFNATLDNPPVINLEWAKTIFENDEVVKIEDDELSVKQIKKAVARFYNLAYKDLEGKSRHKQIANARHIFVYLCRDLLNEPYTSIGYELGKRDHKTISSSYKRAKELISKDAAFAKAVEAIRESIQ